MAKKHRKHRKAHTSWKKVGHTRRCVTVKANGRWMFRKKWACKGKR